MYNLFQAHQMNELNPNGNMLKKNLPSFQRGTVTNNLFPQCSTPTGNAFCGIYVPDASAISFDRETKNKQKINYFERLNCFSNTEII